MGAFYIPRQRLFLQRKFQCEHGAFAYRAVYFNLSVVSLYNSLYIAQSQTKAFDIVNISRMGAEEFFEDATLRLFTHPDAIVFDTDDQTTGRAVRRYADQEIFF